METFIWWNSYSEYLKEHPFLMHYMQMPKLLLRVEDILNIADDNLKILIYG